MPPHPFRPPRPEVLAFLADVKAHPQDDGLRLIFADYLEENGDPLDQARAELIRSQIEYARQPPESPSRQSYGLRARALQQKYGKIWLGPLEPWVKSWSYHRGLLSVRLTLAYLHSYALTGVAGLDGAEAWAWVDEVVLTAVQDGDVSRLGKAPLLATVVSLSFQRCGLGPAGAQALAELTLLRPLYKLDLGHNEIGDRGLGALLDGPKLERLRILDLPCLGLRAEGVGRLARAAGLTRLEGLTVWGNPLDNDGAVALARTTELTHLQHLDLHSTQIGDAGAAAIADSAALASLRELNLADNRIGQVGAKALAASPWLNGVGSLKLWGNPVGAAGAEALRQRFGTRVHVSSGEG